MKNTYSLLQILLALFCVLAPHITQASTSSSFSSLGTEPYDVAIDADGNVYVTNSSANNVSKTTPGGVTSIFGSSILSGPQGITVGPDGNIYTADNAGHGATKFIPGGSTTTFSITGTNPTDIIVDAAGNIYTSNQSSNNVTKITPGGSASTLGTTGSNPVGITMDSLGNIYTANFVDNNVTKITPGGVSTIFATVGTNPSSITIDSFDNLYVSNYGSGTVTKITSGGVATQLGTTGGNPYDIDIDGYGNIYTVNQATSNVTQITPTGVSRTISSTGLFPRGIAVGSDNLIYTANYGDNTITKIIPDSAVAQVSSGAADGPHLAGETLSFSISFTSNIVVSGTPRLQLATSQTSYASYSSQSGTNTLIFSYTVQPGDTASDLDYSSTTALTLNGGSLTDPFGNPAILTLSSPGTQGSLANNKNIILDTTPPTVSDITNGATYFNSISPTFVEGTATLDSNPYTSGTAITSAGSHILIVTDAAGNTTTVNFTITIDTTPPIVSGITNGATYFNTVSPTFTEGTATLNGNPYTSGTAITSAGNHTLIVTDTAGNATTVNFTLILDTTPPVVSGITNGYVYIDSVTPTFTEGTATLDGNPYTSGTAITSAGSHTFIVTDTAGNSSTITFTVAIIITPSVVVATPSTPLDTTQTTSPSETSTSLRFEQDEKDNYFVKVDYNSRNYSKESNPEFKGRYLDAANGTVTLYKKEGSDTRKLIGSKTIKSDGTWIYKLPKKADGKTSYYIQYTDASGNILGKSKTIRLIRDTKKPTLFASVMQRFYKPGDRINFTAEDDTALDYVKVKTNNTWRKQIKRYFIIPSSMSKGLHNLSLRAYDKAGNSILRVFPLNVR